jgi:allophanate hydrolase
VSVFSKLTDDARLVLDVIGAYDPEDPFAREIADEEARGSPLRVGAPTTAALEFFGDAAAAALFDAARDRVIAAGHELVAVDLAPFEAAAELLYGGPWVAERYAAVGDFISRNTGDLDPTVAAIIRAGAAVTGADVFRGMVRLAELRRASERQWAQMDALLLPTTGTTFTIEDVQRYPTELNTHLGRYTNFVNLLGLAAVAIPAGARPDGLPLGVSLVGRCGTDRTLLRVADQLAQYARPPEAEGSGGRPSVPEPW